MPKKDPIFEYLESISELIPAPFYWLDLNGRFLGLNERGLKAISVAKRDDIIGKNSYELYQNKDVADNLQKDINTIVQTGRPSQQEDKVVDVSSGKFIYFSAIRAPLRNSNGKIVGIIGTSINITAEKEAEQLRFEAEKNKVSMAEQDKFRELAKQVVHDIRSPIGTLNMITKQYDVLPEKLRTVLRNATSRLGDITNQLFNAYKPETEGNVDGQTLKELLVVTDLDEILSEKRHEYSDYQIDFNPHFTQAGYFSFIKASSLDFKRMISNLINNAVGALHNKSGKIDVYLDVIGSEVQVIVADNGSGIPEAVKQKILNNEVVTYGKADGSGLGFTHTRETLDKCNGKLAIETIADLGTKIILTFPKVAAPDWIADKIDLYLGDTIVVLDDDESIHGAWDEVFKPYLATIKVQHFTYGKEAIKFLQSQTLEQKNKIFLLTDYELLNQDVNGLDVVARTKSTRSILVTSHHNNPRVLSQATLTHTRILPKPLAHEIPVLIHDTGYVAADNVELEKSKVVIAPQTPKQKLKDNVDMIALDDDEEIINNLKDYILNGKKIDTYSNIHDFLANVSNYAQDTKMLIDYNFKDEEINGVDIIQELYKNGFTNSYLYSGMMFRKGEIPSYIKIIMKDNIKAVGNLFNQRYDDTPQNEDDTKSSNKDNRPETVNNAIIATSSASSHSEKTELQELARKVSHDLRSPVSSLETVIEFSTTLSTTERLTLKRLASKIRDVSTSVMNKYGDIPPEDQVEEQQTLLVLPTIIQILQEKQEKYKNLPIAFNSDYKDVANFSFIKIVPGIFRRMVSDALEMAFASLATKDKAKLSTMLNINGEYVVISVEDNSGSLLSQELVTQINNNEKIDNSKKENEHALKLSKIRDVLDSHLGKLVIYFTKDMRTKIMFRIPYIAAPNWISPEIKIRKDDIVIILDADNSTHSDWDKRLIDTITTMPEVQIKHFKKARELLAFVDNIAIEEKDRICLLANYEELKSYSGSVEKGSKVKKINRVIKRSIMLTNQYNDPQICQFAAISGIKILPKTLSMVAPIILDKKLEPQSRRVDMVWLDDEKMYIDDLIGKHYSHLTVDAYYDPVVFLADVIQYPFNTKILLDHNYYYTDNYKYDVNGVTIAEKLHASGYTNLYLLSGEDVTAKPDYLTVILKTDLNALKNLDKL